ncbi:FadR/GntR family transcriptional regulator [Ferrovibrio xuzhouensis]|uniref:FadR/GntR family transcriptional regulator n=1 Tax=Ferrovibrio xuzhouensis TaxID=1576914 RepID=A0ABV7VGY1_9PROT
MNQPLVNIQGAQITSSHGQVAHALGRGIVLGRHREGELLPAEADLMKQFGTSRTVLREAIKMLAAKGMVVSRSKVGTRVRERSAWNMFDTEVLRWYLEGGVDRRFLRDLAEIRLAVEPAAAALAAVRRSEQDLAAMDAAITTMRDANALNAGYADADLALHLALADACGNVFMRSIGAVIEAALRVSFQLSSPPDPVEHERSWKAHADIVEAIRRGDADAAARATERVIYHGLERHGVLAGEVAG